MEANERLMQLYRLAVANELVSNKTMFAKMIGTTIGTLSSCINGVEKYKGTAIRLAKHAELVLISNNVDVPSFSDSHPTVTRQSPDSQTAVGGQLLDSNQSVIAAINEITEQRKALMQEMAEQRKTYDQHLKRSQDQIDRLIIILEDKGGSVRKAQ